MAEKSKGKWVVLALAAGLVVLVLVVLANRGQAPLVPVVNVTRENLSSTITTNGKVEPISPNTARAEFPTFVEKVGAAEGQSVRRGQVVVTLQAADVRALLSQARSELLSAQSDLRNAHAGGPPDEVAQLQGDLQKAQVNVANLSRAQGALTNLVAKQAATQEELAQNQAELAQARATLQSLEQKNEALKQRAAVEVERAGLRVKQAQDQVEALEVKVRSATVVAATDGTLYALPVKQGDYVKVGEVLAEMADLHHVRVRAFVDEPDMGWLEANQEVEVKWDARPSLTWTGHTEQVPKQVVTLGTRSVGEVLCSVDNTKLELLPNVNVQVHIKVRERPGAVVVPRAAVSFDNGVHYVFLFDGDKLHRREISVGVASVTKYEVLAGLKDGDRVALSGEQVLRDGMDIRATEAK